ncbi:MAG TPA: hypothetical protein VNL77_08675, partial [Roseiflexaceae bacterium]|nr:hypothetical protein [Roseiflexaceae bacterium]
MTIAELLALVGRAWSRLALYPGGLAVLVALWLAAAPPWARGRETPDARGETPDARPETEDATEDIESRHVARSTQHATLTLSSIVLPWLAVALLPLPYAAPLGRPVDLVVALALLEWPRLLAVARDLRDEGGRPRALRRLAAMLNGYPPLVLVALVIGQGAGSLELGLIAAAPQERAPALVRALYWLGAA